MTENRIQVVRTVEGFSFVATAQRHVNTWTVKAWEIPYKSSLVNDPKWSDERMLNNHLASIDVTHAPETTTLVWEEIADMLDICLMEAKARDAAAAGPFSDQQSKGPGS